MKRLVLLVMLILSFAPFAKAQTAPTTIYVHAGGDTEMIQSFTVRCAQKGPSKGYDFRFVDSADKLPEHNAYRLMLSRQDVGALSLSGANGGIVIVDSDGKILFSQIRRNHWSSSGLRESTYLADDFIGFLNKQLKK